MRLIIFIFSKINYHSHQSFDFDAFICLKNYYFTTCIISLSMQISKLNFYDHFNFFLKTRKKLFDFTYFLFSTHLNKTPYIFYIVIKENYLQS